MGLKLISGPGIGSPSDTEPVSLAEALAHLRIDSGDEDALISSLVTAARTYAENYCNRAFITQVWDLVLDAFPRDILELPKAPLQDIEEVVYIDHAGAEQTLAASQYKVDTITDPGRIAPAYGEAWPVTRGEPNAVRIRFSAGYGGVATAVPAPIKHAILLLVAHLFENREAARDGAWSRLPFGVDALLSPYRILRWD